jgi:hypothetical protein
MKCWLDMYLFNSAVGRWACAVSNGVMVGKQWIGKHAEGRNHGLIGVLTQHLL